MEIPITLPLDRDGFLRRECPHCQAQFKWHNGPANAEAEEHPPPPAYHCPLCGQPAGSDSWWTQEQLEYAEAQAAPAITEYIDQSLDDVFKGFKNNAFVTFKRTGHLNVPDAPTPLVEANDMDIVMSPCHPYEPVKVSEDHTGPLYCIVCGSAFAV